jgi:hypothetical protein
MRKYIPVFVLLLTALTPAVSADSPPLFVFADIGDGQLGLINTETDVLIQVDVSKMDGWPGNGVVFKQHAWVTSDGRTIYMSIDATPPSPGGIVVFDVHSIDWVAGEADISIQKSLIVDPEGSLSDYPEVEQTVPGQPIAEWVEGTYTQLHGPSFRPRSPFSYVTVLTDDRIVAFNTRTNEFSGTAPYSYGEISAQTHGLSFNAAGTLALGTGYYFDNSKIDLYLCFPGVAQPFPIYSFELRDGQERGAFTHYTVWLNQRYAYTATQQFDETSLTPAGGSVSTPGIWLLDIWTGRALRVVGTAETPEDPGVLRSPSDVNIANGKLYVAEEDTLDGSFGDDGFVAVYDVSIPHKPQFLKRFKPGEELPADFSVAHGLTVSPDQKYVFAASYASSYIVKIDTDTDTVTKVWGPEDGLSVPHGGFIAGSIR